MHTYNRQVFLGLLAVVVSVQVCASERETGFEQDVNKNVIPHSLIAGVCIDDQKGVLHLDCVEQVINQTIDASTKLKKTAWKGAKDDPDPYYVIHLLRWKDREATQAVDVQHWYVFHKGNWSEEAFATKDRIFGKKQVYLLFLHLNKDPGHHYSVRYRLLSKSKLPAFVDHFASLLGMFMPSAGGGGEAQERNFWGTHPFQTFYTPSDLTLTPEIFKETYDPKPGDSAGATATKPADPPKLDAHTFDNEGLYRIDFTVGVPITKISETMFVSTSNSLVPAKVEKQKLFALFDLYPVPVDIKSSGFSPWPHLVTGMGIGSQPLKKVLIGVGYGPLFAHFYAGLLLHTQQLPNGTGCGSTLTITQLQGKLSNKTCPELSFGLNISVGSALEALKPKKSATSGTSPSSGGAR